MSWLVVILTLLGLIFIHELGHFLAAKLVGIRATRFYVGFKPALVKRQVGDTEYGIGAIPLGGYVHLVGMLRPGKDDVWFVGDAAKEAAERREAGRADHLTPAAVAIRESLADGELADLPRLVGLARTALDDDVDLLHEKTLAEARQNLDRLEESLDRGAYWRAATWRRVVTILAGPLANVLAAFVAFFVFFGVTGIPVYEADERPVVGTVSGGSPAASAGIRAGDAIISIGGAPITTWESIGPAVRATGGEPTTVVIERDGARTTLEGVDPTTAQDGRFVIGVSAVLDRIRTDRYGAGEAAQRSVRTMWEVTSGTFSVLSRLVVGQGREQLSSVVGIVDQGEQTVQEGTFVGTIGLVSLALAIFNLLPFLPLDGGHVAVSLIERLRGRPVSRVVLERVSVAGIMVVLALFFIGLSNDLGRLG